VTERETLIALNRVSGLGAITLKRLIETFGAVTALPGKSPRELMKVSGIGSERAELFSREFDNLRFDDELDRAAKMNVKLITWSDPAYPSFLKEIADPPLVLYVAGEPSALTGTTIAIIGTRRPTIYGRETARRFGYQLAGAGCVVVSGLALGIDTEAHRGAVQAAGKSVAVIGGALDCLYPRENRELAREMVSAGGAVITEYPFGRQPDRQTFPMRNRIVSGLSRGVLVVEAPLNSGTMITVDQALDQGRTVMAVPGRIDSPSSQGCHKLLRSGARLVTSVDDITEELQELSVLKMDVRETKIVTSTQQPAGNVAPESPDERKILAVVEHEEMHIDTIINQSEMPAGLVNALLVGLQIKRRVKLMPGGMVKRI